MIQQRASTSKKYPGYLETVSGGVEKDEDAITGIIRELEEELGIRVSKDNLIFIGSYARVNDFVEVFLLKTNIDIEDLKLQEDEVQTA